MVYSPFRAIEVYDELYCYLKLKVSAHICISCEYTAFHLSKKEIYNHSHTPSHAVFLLCTLDIFPSSNDAIIEMILAGEHDDIGAEKLRGLIKILPEPDEVR